MRMRAGWAVGAAALTITRAATALQGIPDDLERLIEHLGFDRADVDELREGEVIRIEEDLEEGSANEMAVSVAVLLPTSLDGAVGIVAGSIASDPAVIAHGQVTDSTTELGALGYAREEWKEVRRLLEIEDGSEFNLSKDEIERFQRLARRLYGRSPKKDPAVRDMVNALLREVILERCRAYREGGLASVATYERGDEEEPARPDLELRLAIREDRAQDARLGPLVDDVQRALQRYPDRIPEGVESDFFWVRADVADRPCFILTHRMSKVTPAGAVFADRQFYVGHSYNALAMVMVALPTDEGVLLLHRTRTFTDKVAGKTGLAKKPLGRRRMRKAIIEFMEALRDAAD